MGLEVRDFLTFEDIVASGMGCVGGVLEACKEAGIYFGMVDDVLMAFPDERQRIMQAANLDGDGDGNGNGGTNGFQQKINLHSTGGFWVSNEGTKASPSFHV